MFMYIDKGRLNAGNIFEVLEGDGYFVLVLVLQLYITDNEGGFRVEN